MRISDWSSDVCSSDLCCRAAGTRCDEPADRRLEPRVGGERARRGGGARRTCGRDERGAAQARRPLVRQIGRALCRERVCQYVSISVVSVSLKKKIYNTERS